MDTINLILNQYLQTINSAFGLIQGHVVWLLNFLIIMNIVLSAMLWALSEDQVMVKLARKIVYIGFFMAMRSCRLIHPTSIHIRKRIRNRLALGWIIPIVHHPLSHGGVIRLA